MSGSTLNDATNAQGAPEGIEETPVFFDQGIFAVVHRPQKPGHPGWVMCSPFGSERTNSHRLYVLWARQLAAAGHWALRFDYRGTGDSAGAFEDFTVHDHIDDISVAIGELERMSGMPCRGLLGLRLGADLASICAANSDKPLDLVLWEPIVDGNKYRNSLLRLAMANELVNSSGPHRSRADFRRELAAGKTVSVDGFPLTAEMHEALATVDLSALGRPTSRPILVVQMKSGTNRPLKPAVTSLVESYSAEGDTDLRSVVEPLVWMRTKSYRWHLDDLFGQTLGWMAERIPPTCSNQTPSPTRSVRNEHRSAAERPVGFEVEGEWVWGILHEPFEPTEEAPAIVMASAGEACRSAFFYPRLARDLADRGWRVLRFDPRGIGDSYGSFDCDLLSDVFVKIESGGLVPDVVAALDFMEAECGTSNGVLIGLCGGAITSVIASQVDDRVLGLGPFEFSLRMTRPLGRRRQTTQNNRLPWDEFLSRHQGTLFLLTAHRIFRMAREYGKRCGFAISKALSIRSVPGPGEMGWYRETIGEDANFPMLKALETSLDKRIPMCCVFADSEDVRLFETALPGLLAGRSHAESLIDLRIVEGADHNFIMPGFAAKLTAELVSWLDDRSESWPREPERQQATE